MSETMTITETTPTTFFVASESDERKGYPVNIEEGTCGCPQYEHRGLYCKHQDIVDQKLIVEERLDLSHCKAGNNIMDCSFIQTMLDRGYIQLSDTKWKKREAYDAMPEDKKLSIITEAVDREILHVDCSIFHLFKQEEKDELPNTLSIEAYLHCGKCIEEFKEGKHKGESPQSMQKIQAGWTIQGLQLWCVRHECNVLHIDFEGQKHPANTTRKGENS